MIAGSHGQAWGLGRDGSMIIPEDQKEIEEALAVQQPGFVREKLEILAYQTTFNPEKRTGQVPINTSIIRKDKFKKAILVMKDAFRAGICVSDLIAIASEGERLGSVVIPDRHIGIATVCSVVINGVLLRAGVPCEFRFGGILQIRNSEPRRFVAIIEYSGTSIDPSEQFIRANMTSISEAINNGNGKILGVFRTIPAPAREAFEVTIALLKEAGIGGVYTLGNTSEALCQIPVALNRIGIVQLSGLNPIAAASETGIEIENIAESGLIDFKQLQSFWEI